MDIQLGERLPNEIRATLKKRGINRLLTFESVNRIANKISKHFGKPLNEIEIRSLISHIKKLDGSMFLNLSDEESATRIASGFVGFKAKNDHVIYDTHEIMKQYIGGGVQVNPDRFLLRKTCGDTNETPNDVNSVARTVDYQKAYAIYPRLNTPMVQAGTENMYSGNFPGAIGDSGDDPVVERTVEAQSLGLIRGSRDKDSNGGEPVVGDYLRKGNMIETRTKSQKVLLDSRYRNRSTQASVYSWRVSYAPNDDVGSVSLQFPMSNIIAMQFEEFHIPYVAAADNPYKKITLLVEEFQLSSVAAHENRQYHMMFDSTIETNRIKLVPPTQDEGKYNFSAPINWVDRVSLTFGNPLTPIKFLPELYIVYLTVNGVASTYLNFNQNHFMSDGEIVILTGFTTANPATDFSVIDSVNDLNGHSIAVVNNTTVEITTDLTGITMISPPQNLECYITTRRIFVSIRFIFVQ